MLEAVSVDAQLIALVGSAMVLATITAALCQRVGVPVLVGYLILGVALRFGGDRLALLTEPVLGAFRLLADLGIVALLFSVGLESNSRALLAKLGQATPIWIGNVLVSGGSGFAAAYWLLDLGVIAALVCAVALSATSVGVAVALWREAGMLDSADGALLVDVAELDDISAMALMALLFAAIPALVLGNGFAVDALTNELLRFGFALLLFGAVCVLFAVFLERFVVIYANHLRQPPDRMLLVAGVGFMIAALAAALGFSLAIGALFAGFVFSRDPEAVKTEASFRYLYSLFVPFFFIGIGIQVVPEYLLDALPVALVLLLAAVVGKLVGTWLPALLLASASTALVISVSMIPRAEIALVIFDEARRLVPEQIDAKLYSGGVIACALTCVLTPLLLSPLLRRRRARQVPDQPGA